MAHITKTDKLQYMTTFLFPSAGKLTEYYVQFTMATQLKLLDNTSQLAIFVGL